MTIPFAPEPADPSSGAPEPVDPFSDLDALRVSPDTGLSVAKVLISVPVRKPRKDEFFRVHPDDDFTMDAYTAERESDTDREVYLVFPGYAEAVYEVARHTRLFTCVNKRGNPFIWPAKLPLEGSSLGKQWTDSALKVAEQARTCWVRMAGNRDAGAYELFIARGDLGEPKWPEGKTFRDLLRLAFEDRIIDRVDHPLIRELRGEL